MLIGIVYGHERDAHPRNYTPSALPRSLEDAYPAAATAAVALAQLHNTKPDSDWESEAVGLTHDDEARHRITSIDHMIPPQEYPSENEARQPKMHSTIELPPIQNHLAQNSIPPFHSPRPRDLLPSMMARSPPGRSSTLPPIQRRDKPARPRKSSITQNARKPKHERTRSKDHARRLSIEGRKAFSAEPQSAASAMGKRWEDLIEAATSANEADSDRDLTPVWPHHSPRHILGCVLT